MKVACSVRWGAAGKGLAYANTSPAAYPARAGVIGPFRIVTVREMRIAELSKNDHPPTVDFDTRELLAVKVARAVREGAVGKGPHPEAPRRRPTSRHVRFGGGPSEKDQHQLAPRRRPTLPFGGFGKGPSEKDPYCGHLTGGLLHSKGGPPQQCGGPTRPNAGSRKATGNRDDRAVPSAAVPYNWPDTGECLARK